MAEEEEEGIDEMFEEAEFNLKQSVLKRLAKRRVAMEGAEEGDEQEEKTDDKEDLGKLI